MTDVIFRVDTGREDGLGHLQRCLALAHAVRAQGHSPVFAVDSDSESQRRIAARNFVSVAAVDRAGTPDDLAYVLGLARDRRAGAIVVDSYHVGPEYLEELRSGSRVVLVVDDLCGMEFPCDLVVNGGAQAQHLPYRGVRDDTRFLLGCEYTLLVPEIAWAEKRSVRRQAEEVLLTLGGADRVGLTGLLLDALDGFELDVRLTVVVGPQFETPPGPQSHRPDVRFVRSPKSLIPVMGVADLAISGGGQTTYELAAMGVPCLAIQVAENQADSLKALHRAGVLERVGAVTDEGIAGRVWKAVADLVGSEERRQLMSERGRTLVDGLGANRVALELSRLLTWDVATSKAPDGVRGR